MTKYLVTYELEGDYDDHNRQIVPEYGSAFDVSKALSVEQVTPPFEDGWYMNKVAKTVFYVWDVGHGLKAKRFHFGDLTSTRRKRTPTFGPMLLLDRAAFHLRYTRLGWETPA